jgi:hypothetical protein
MPGMVGERRPGEARQTDYITPFTVNARATCFRYDGRVAPQQILRDGEVTTPLSPSPLCRHLVSPACEGQSRGFAHGTHGAGSVDMDASRANAGLSTVPGAVALRRW